MNTIATEINDLCNKYKSPFCIAAYLADKIRNNQECMSADELEIYRLFSIIFYAKMDNDQDNCPYIIPYRPTGEDLNLQNLSESFLQLISTTTHLINHPLARGRLTDLLWINKCKIKIKPNEWANKTIDDYIPSSILNNITWHTWGRDELERAIILCKKLKDNEKLNRIISQISDEIMQSTTNHYCVPIQLLDLMAKYRLPIDCNSDVLIKIETLALEFGELSNFTTQQQFYQSLSDFYKQINEDKFVEYKKLEGLSCYNFGKNIISSKEPNYLQASIVFRTAFQIFREIPNIYRSSLNIGFLMNDSQRKQRECLIESQKHATTFTSTVDVSDHIEQTHQFINRLNFNQDPLGSLAMLFWKTHPETYKTRYDRAIQNMKDCLIMQIGQTFITTKDGRFAKSISPDKNMGNEDNDDRINHMMFMHYDIYISFVVYLTLQPTLDIIRKGSFLTEKTIEEIVKRSPFIFPEKRKMWIRGLLAGVQGDFMIALFILSPLVEDFIRTILKYGYNVDTIHTNPDGQQMEKGLSTLINEPMIEKAIEKDLVYELNVLFCDNIGYNLRNNIAHGLVYDDLTESYISVYAWWFVFKLIFLSANCITDKDN